MLIDDVKRALRKTSDSLNPEIELNIKAARLEMKRVGIAPDVADADYNDLIKIAIIDFCLWRMASDEKLAERYGNRWNNAIENIRKSSGYMAGDCDDDE